MSRILVLILSCLFIASVSAGQKKETILRGFSFQADSIHENYNFHTMYLGVSLGASVSKVGTIQTDTTLGYDNGYYQYAPTSGYSWAALFGINGGFDFKMKEKTFLSVGLGLYQSTNLISKGDCSYSSQNTPIYLHDKYSYNVQSTRLMLETQLYRYFNFNKFQVAPFILLGIGPSFNYANGYQTTLNPNQKNDTDTYAGFKAAWTVGLAYQLGGGIAIPFNNNHDRISVSYRFVNLGDARFGSEEGYDYKLEVGKIKSHEVYINYNHLFNI